MGAKLLEIDGTSIKFICEVKKPSTSSVYLSNISDEYVAFKVKTTSPKRYCVRPNSGIISPKSACDFTVTMQGLRSAPSEVDCKDKFLIQSTVVDSEMREEDVTLELFSKSSGKYVEEKKLKVVLVSKQDSPSEEHKNKISEKEPPKEASIKEENQAKKDKVSEKEHKHNVPEKEHRHKVSEKEHKNKVSDKDLPKETSMKEENLVKKDENAFSMHTKIEDPKEAKGALTTEDPKSYGDPDGNEQNYSKNLESAPVKMVKEDSIRKLRLRNQLKELRLKETSLENQLKEAKSTISSLTCQNSKIIETKRKLQLELDRRSKKGYPFTFVCAVSFLGLISGYFSDP
uniref:vesicle-associated protein 2-2-like n=1 Tax=Erigeron canadensis TaxID=72917 RepID=UPI001CB88C48|nr:vesicle-associated protein 2-2-like [Erigeron canadensis]